MDQASALLAASCERNPAVPRTSSSCSRFEDRSQTGALPPARLDPQSAPHVAPSNRDPRPSSPALCSTQRDICCRIFTPAQPDYPAASVRDNCSGAYSIEDVVSSEQAAPHGYILKESFGQLWSYEREGWARPFFEQWRA